MTLQHVEKVSHESTQLILRNKHSPVITPPIAGTESTCAQTGHRNVCLEFCIESTKVFWVRAVFLKAIISCKLCKPIAGERYGISISCWCCLGQIFRRRRKNIFWPKSNMQWGQTVVGVATWLDAPGTKESLKEYILLLWPKLQAKMPKNPCYSATIWLIWSHFSCLSGGGEFGIYTSYSFWDPDTSGVPEQ